jgi:hypothetical protein
VRTSPLRRELRLAALLVALACLPGCSLGNAVRVKAKPPEVNVKKYPLDLAFGKEPPPPAPSRGPVPAPTVPRPPDSGPGEVAFPDYTPPDPTTPPPPPRPACPPVGPNTVALEPITTDVQKPVVPGVYTWQQEGTLDILGIGKIPITGLTTRTVRDVVVDEESTAEYKPFSYQVELSTGARRQVVRLRVVPGDGIFVAGIETTANGEKSSFNPLVPVEIFPLPAVELASVTSAGADPLTGETLVVNATIKEKRRIDGCDEVVDGWYVEDARWTFQRGPASQVQTYSYAVATQHGGLVVADHLRTTESFGAFQATIDVRTAFGSIHPKPEKPTS